MLASSFPILLLSLPRCIYLSCDHDNKPNRSNFSGEKLTSASGLGRRVHHSGRGMMELLAVKVKVLDSSLGLFTSSVTRKQGDQDGTREDITLQAYHQGPSPAS